MTFRAQQLTRQLAINPPPLPSLKNVKFGTLFTPHIFEVDAINSVWGPPRIIPFHNFSMPPQSSCLHYGLQCFEGMKAYSDATGNIRLFRPERNCQRMLNSMQRLCFPFFDTNELLQCIYEYVKIEKNYIPSERGYSLYLRPTAIGTGDHLAAAPSSTTKLFIIASPVGPYYLSGMKPVRLLVEEHRRRAFIGGTGNYKIGANYAAPMLVQKEAAEKGYEQVLWLGAEGQVQEVGAMNFLCVWKPNNNNNNNKSNNNNNNNNEEVELITAPLDGTILPGITRDSILSLVKQNGIMRVTEKHFTIYDLVKALKEERVLECFGCGTAAIVSPIKELSFAGVDYKVPCPEPEKSIAHKMLKTIMDIQYGVVDHEWSHVVPV